MFRVQGLGFPLRFSGQPETDSSSEEAIDVCVPECTEDLVLAQDRKHKLSEVGSFKERDAR